MATSREESSRYDGGGLGAGGKFKKRPFRRTTQATPYDRPPVVVRNPVNGDGNGWLSKIVDPAQRLITYSANKLFASVFRKHLPPAPPRQSPEPEINQETREIYQEAASTEPQVRHDEAFDRRGDNQFNHSDGSRFTELEHILKQKTFSRAEIDRLTALLRSRTVDSACGIKEKRSEAKLAMLPDRRSEYPVTPVRDNVSERHLTSTPAAALNPTKVLVDDISSPVELAKAYMGSQPYKVSESRLTFPRQPRRDDFHRPSNSMFTSNSAVVSHVPQSPGHMRTPGNGFVLPRSRGRSAIYNMARTPYSRTSSTAALKSPGHITDDFAGPSSSSSPHSAQDQSRLSVARQVALKRRLDNDIGSVGPIRRIRMKSNLSPRSLGAQASGSPLPIHGGGSDFYSQNSLSLLKKTSSENGINSTPSRSFTPIPSKSSQMASKILEQLDEIVSTREKSPAKLSPSVLSGPALKSPENVDSSKVLENFQDRLDGLRGVTSQGIQDSTPSKQDKVEENSRAKLPAPPDKSTPLVNGIGTSYLSKDDVPSSSAANSHEVKTVTFIPQQKKRGFHMSAQEDLDDDGEHLNGGASTSFSLEGEKFDHSVTKRKNVAPEATSMERPSLAEIQPLASSALNQKSNTGPYDGYMITEKKASVTSSPAILPTTSSQPVVLASVSTSTIEEPVTTESSPSSSQFNSGVGMFSSKEQTASLPTFSFVSGNVNKAEPITEASGFKFDGCTDLKAGISNSFESVATAANHIVKPAESDKADDSKRALNGAPKTASVPVSLTSSPAGNIFNFGALANNSNGSLASTNTPFSGSNGTVSTFNASPAATTEANGVSVPISAMGSSSQVSVPLATIVSAAVFNFSSSGKNGEETKETGPADTGGIFGFTTNSSSGASSASTSVGISPFSSLASTTPAAGSSIFGFASSATTSTTNSIFPSASASTSMTGGSIFGFSTPAASSSLNQSQGGVATSNQSSPFQFASSVPSSGSSFSDSTAVTTSSAAALSLFGSNWAAPKTTPIFSPPSSSSVFSFGASSTSVAGSTTPPMVFGSSSSSIAPSSNFPAASTPTPPIFGNTTPGFGFGQAPASTGNVDQMDTMAEDTVQAAAPIVPAFGQQPVSPPASGFIFGATPAPTTPTPGANPFQFGGQQIIPPAPQNPFQASSSLGLNTGGSFSLGSGGPDKSARKIVRVSRSKNRKK